MLLALDGNNSAKRVLSAGTEDARAFNSTYFLSRQEVDRFKDEVKRKHAASTEDYDYVSKQFCRLWIA